MRDRHVLETVLIRRFPQATPEQVATAANAIMALIELWTAEDRLKGQRRPGRAVSRDLPLAHHRH